MYFNAFSAIISISFYKPWKQRNTFGFLEFSGGYKMGIVDRNGLTF